jgi:hypothetical protein
MANVHTLPIDPANTTNEDPACTAETLAADRMKALINECSKGGRRQLTEARDKIDDLMRALDARGEMLTSAVTEYAGFVQQAVEMKSVIMGPIESLAGEVTLGLTAPGPGRTLTQTDEVRHVRTR